MGLDGMRVGGGRCPPLFVGGLLLACFLLVCNWWSLSTENLELLRQIDEFNEAIKISGEERDQCIALKENIQQRHKHLEDEVGTLHVRLQQMNDLKKQNDQLSESVTICKSELDSLNKLDATKSVTLETLRIEKDTISSQLKAKRDENEKLKADLETMKGEKDTLNTQLDAKDDENDKLNNNLETALADIEKLKLSINAQPKEKDDKFDEPMQLPTSKPINADDSVDGDAKEDTENNTDVNMSGVENPLEGPDDPLEAKPPSDQ